MFEIDGGVNAFIRSVMVLSLSLQRRHDSLAKQKSLKIITLCFTKTTLIRNCFIVKIRVSVFNIGFKRGGRHPNNNQTQPFESSSES